MSRRPKIAVFQHVPYEPLGTFDPLLKAAGMRLRYINHSRQSFDLPDLAAIDGVIALGGPMNACDDQQYPNLAPEADFLARAAAANLPVLGICLGAQLLARGLGGEIHADAAPEIGWHRVQLTQAGRADRLLSQFAVDQEVFQWHLDAIAPPPDCEVLATSQVCPVQAFRCDAAWGLQFHLEVDEPLVDRWLSQPTNQPALEFAAVSPSNVRTHYPSSMPALQRLAADTFGAWVNLFDLPSRKVALPSR